MENCIRVLLAIEPRMLRIALKQAINGEDGLKAVATASDPVDVLLATRETEADVVICDQPATGEMPGICSQLLHEFPELLVVAVSPDGKGVRAYQQTITSRQHAIPSLGDLFSTIRAAKAAQFDHAS